MILNFIGNTVNCPPKVNSPSGKPSVTNKDKRAIIPNKIAPNFANILYPLLNNISTVLEWTYSTKCSECDIAKLSVLP